MLGDPDSCGVWAPCLTYADGLFYLIYTDVKRYGRTTVAGASGASLRDFHNYLVTQPADRRRMVGPGLPEQQRLRSLAVSRRGRTKVPASTCSGTTGRVRTASPASCSRSTRPRSASSSASARLIFTGTSIGFTEAPHLYKRNGYYYLITAEGGTGWGHAVTMARSRTDRAVRAAPRHLHPDARASARRELQRAGHADLVETQNGETTWSISAAARFPIAGAARWAARRRSRDGLVGATAGCARWTATDSRLGSVRRRRCRPTRFPQRRIREDFDDSALPHRLQWLRSPWPESCSA